MFGQSQVPSSSLRTKIIYASSHLTQLWETPENLMVEAQTLQPAWPEKQTTHTVTPEA